MQERYKEIIAKEFRDCVTGTISRLDNTETNRPFHEALLSKDALFWSRFERSFSTSFGQKTIERISKVAADSGGATQSENQKITIVTVSSSKLRAIENHITALRNNTLGRRPNWSEDLGGIVHTADDGRQEQLRIISDLWWEKNGINHFMSIKTVKPNIDQTAEAKRDLLKLKVVDLNCRVYFGLYYNPFGDARGTYAWSPPMGIFDFIHDPVVLIGRDYWDTLGGAGTYEEVLAIAHTVGKETQAQVGALGLR